MIAVKKHIRKTGATVFAAPAAALGTSIKENWLITERLKSLHRKNEMTKTHHGFVGGWSGSTLFNGSWSYEKAYDGPGALDALNGLRLLEWYLTRGGALTSNRISDEVKQWLSTTEPYILANKVAIAWLAHRQPLEFAHYVIHFVQYAGNFGGGYQPLLAACDFRLRKNYAPLIVILHDAFLNKVGCIPDEFQILLGSIKGLR